MEYQESILRDEQALNFATELHRRGLAFKYVGNLCFEFQSMRSAVQGFELASRMMPKESWKAFKLTNTNGARYFVESI